MIVTKDWGKYKKGDTVSITDGTNDGGIDVKIFEKKKGRKNL